MEHVSSVRPTGKFPEKVENLKRWSRFPGWNFRTECRVPFTFLVVCTSSRSTVGHPATYRGLRPNGTTFYQSEIPLLLPPKFPGFCRKWKAPLDSKTKPDMPDTMQRVQIVQRNRTLKLCYIFSSNNTCNLDVVGKILSCLKEKLGVKMLAFKNHFSLSDTTEMCESIIPDLPMDFAIFVVQANEDRFLINEDSAKIYRTLWNATGKF